MLTLKTPGGSIYTITFVPSQSLAGGAMPLRREEKTKYWIALAVALVLGGVSYFFDGPLLIMYASAGAAAFLYGGVPLLLNVRYEMRERRSNDRSRARRFTLAGQ